MKKTLILSFLAGTCIFLANCSHKTTGPVTKAKRNPDMDKVAEVKATFSNAQIEQGKTIYENNCGKCHKLYDPQDFGVSKWEGVLPVMTKKAKMDDDHAGLVRAYVLSNVKVG